MDLTLGSLPPEASWPQCENTPSPWAWLPTPAAMAISAFLGRIKFGFAVEAGLPMRLPAGAGAGRRKPLFEGTQMIVNGLTTGSQGD